EDVAYLEEVTDDIAYQFGSSLLLRLGGEYALNKLRFRAGLNVNGSPFAAESEVNTAYSLGLGFRERNYYFDLAYKRSELEETQAPYLLNGGAGQLASNDVSINRFLLTVGFRF
ncbi:MAG: hypothetical protein AAFP19_23810, partial [Bacteroidota bacterium]